MEIKSTIVVHLRWGKCLQRKERKNTKGVQRRIKRERKQSKNTKKRVLEEQERKKEQRHSKIDWKQ